jgi:DHA1 family tetracycline resistance protein-like MFS transporter
MRMKRVLPIFLIVFTNLLGSGVILPVLPLFAVGQMGATEAQAALLSSAYFAAQFMAAPWLGRLSDRHGRRPILMISQVGTVISFVMFIFAAPLGDAIDQLGWPIGMSGGLVMLFLARILDGLTGGNITTARAYISDITTEDDRAVSLGYLSAAFGLGFIFGPAFGGLLGSYGPIAPFIGAAVITAITLLLTYFILAESLPPEERGASRTVRQGEFPVRRIFETRSLLWIFSLGFFSTLAFAAVPPTFSLYADRVIFAGISDPTAVPRNIGMMLSFLGGVTVLTQLVIYPRLVARLRERTLVLLGQVILTLSMTGIGLFSTPLLSTLNLAPFAFSRAVTDPSLQSLVTRFGTARTQGRLLGLYQSTLSMATIVGPIWAGWVFQNISPGATYTISGGVLVISVVIAGLLLAQENPSENPVDA